MAYKVKIREGRKTRYDKRNFRTKRNAERVANKYREAREDIKNQYPKQYRKLGGATIKVVKD